ncbi:hypothetical protein D9V76_00880 [Buchnera aphidicola (Rhopalosiphum padi)]|uniref:CvpA family protein n=1 Tax=Buchnera aphidicola subsp. Rhopalosiphum padi TaxID=98793 RepID=A0A4D6YAA2_BUCRP|nr:CvpA family protein [Buchnera aphidicola]QCI25223.1 hypothetical protein D9V76_00880 [Buchnera aphidicola (Rhopalosiphum padi)]
MFFIFYILNIILNFFLKKVFVKIGLSYLNIALGGVFGLFRGIILVFFLLFFVFYFNNLLCLDYLNHSLLIKFLLHVKDYFSLNFW